MDTLLKRVANCDLYTLHWENGKIHIRILGYFYDAEFGLEDERETWRYNEFSGYDMPLEEYLKSDWDDRSAWEEQCTRGVGDHTPEYVLDFFTDEETKPIPLWVGEITEEDVNEDKVYINTIY